MEEQPYNSPKMPHKRSHFVRIHSTTPIHCYFPAHFVPSRDVRTAGRPCENKGKHKVSGSRAQVEAPIAHHSPILPPKPRISCASTALPPIRWKFPAHFPSPTHQSVSGTPYQIKRCQENERKWSQQIQAFTSINAAARTFRSSVPCPTHPFRRSAQ